MGHLDSYADFTYNADLLSVLCILSSFDSYVMIVLWVVVVVAVAV